MLSPFAFRNHVRGLISSEVWECYRPEFDVRIDCHRHDIPKYIHWIALITDEWFDKEYPNKLYCYHKSHDIKLTWRNKVSARYYLHRVMKKHTLDNKMMQYRMYHRVLTANVHIDPELPAWFYKHISNFPIIDRYDDALVQLTGLACRTIETTPAINRIIRGYLAHHCDNFRGNRRLTGMCLVYHFLHGVLSASKDPMQISWVFSNYPTHALSVLNRQLDHCLIMKELY